MILWFLRNDAYVPQPAKIRKASESVNETNAVPDRRKSSTAKSQGRKTVPSASAPPDSTQPVPNIADLKNENRKKIAEALQKKIDGQIRELSKQKTYRIPDNHTAL